MRELFERHLTMYASYHRDPRNRATHFVGIPLIVFSVLLALAQVRLPLGGVELSLAVVVLGVVWLLWVLLDPLIGLAIGAFVLPAWWLAEWTSLFLGAGAVWTIFGLAFVGGWAFQLVGHAYEGKRPALLDNLFQALIGPMFLIAEILVALGLRPDLRRRIQAGARA